MFLSSDLPRARRAPKCTNRFSNKFGRQFLSISINDERKTFLMTNLITGNMVQANAPLSFRLLFRLYSYSLCFVAIPRLLLGRFWFCDNLVWPLIERGGQRCRPFSPPPALTTPQCVHLNKKENSFLSAKRRRPSDSAQMSPQK